MDYPVTLQNGTFEQLHAYDDASMPESQACLDCPGTTSLSTPSPRRPASPATPWCPASTRTKARTARPTTGGGTTPACSTCRRCAEGQAKPILTLLCPNGTLYNQQYFVCDWWFNVDCSVVSSWAGVSLPPGGRPLLLERRLQRGPGDLGGQDGPGVGVLSLRRTQCGVTHACTCASH